MRGRSGPRPLLLTVLALALVLTTNHLPNVAAPATPQPSNFYFHTQTSKTLNTITTNLWANTTQSWSSTTQTVLRTVSSGSPGVWHFYSQPAVAGNVTFTGPLTFIVYFSSSSSTGGGTVITASVNKITSIGTLVSLSTGSLSSAITTTNSPYTIALTSNTYQIEGGAILDFSVSVSIGGSSKTITLSYDTAASPSQAAITFQQRVGVNYFSTFNQTGIQTGFFSRNWTATGRQVTLTTSVFDALGLYDLASVKANLTSPTGTALLTNSPLTRVQGTNLNYTGAWSLNWTYTSNALSGIYPSSLRVLDNSGLSVATQLSYTVYASWLLNLQALSMDPTPVPVPGVSVTIFAGSTAVYNGASNSSGWVSPQNIQLRDNASYNLKAFWQGSLVNQTTAYIPISSLTTTLHLSVYQFDFTKLFLDGNAKPLPQPPSSIQIAYPNGTTASLNPSGTYVLPAGTYSISSVTWKGVNVAPSPITFNPKNGIQPITLQIYDLTLTVVDQAGQPASGATVTLTLNGQTITRGTTGLNGTLVLRALPKGQYVVAVGGQSQTINVSQNTNSKIQFTPASGNWVTQSLGWILLGAAAGGMFGYWEFYRVKHPYDEKPFEYLDSLTSGSFRDGDIVLIEADTGTGKTTLCDELAYKSLQSAHPVVYLTYDNPDFVRQRMKSMHWDTSMQEAQGFFQLVGCELTKPQKMDNTPGFLENFYDITVLDMSISSGLGEVNGQKPTLVIDLTAELAERSSLNGLINLVAETSRRIKKMNSRFFVSVSKTASKSALAELEAAADSVLEMTTITEIGNNQTAQLAVRKMRGRKFDNRAVRIRIHQGKGILFQVPKSGKRKLVHGNS